MAKHGKKYRAALEKFDREAEYAPREAVALVKETSTSKFDGTVELHIRLGVDPRHADQQVRDTVVLPHGLGKAVRVAVFAQGEGAKIAKDAGADVLIDGDEAIKRIEGGEFNFDVAIATPDQMGNVGRLGRVLGPRGLMPNPKTGTVVNADGLAEAIEQAKSGRIEFRVDKTANVHVSIGKVSFDEGKLLDNLRALVEAVRKARPAAAKGAYFRKVVLTSTMGPGIKVSPSQAMQLGMDNEEPAAANA
jgi:large subunit ribosomal protein L1